MLELTEVSCKVNEEYWLNRLRGIHYHALFREDKESHQDSLRIDFKELDIPFPHSLSDLLNKASKGKTFNKYLFLIGGLFVIAQRYTLKYKQMVTTPCLRSLVEPCDSLVFISCNLREAGSCRQLLKHVYDDVISAAERSNYNWESFERKFIFNSGSELKNLFRLGLFYDKINVDSTYLDRLSLQFRIKELESGDLTLSIKFDSAKIAEDYILRMGGHYCKVLQQMGEDLEMDVNTMSILSEPERNLILKKFQGKKLKYDKCKTLLHLFGESVDKYPDSVCLIYENWHFTYRTLDEQSSRLANFIQSHYDVKPGDFIGLIVPHSEWRLISILAVLKAGAAYAPIKEDFPLSRIRFMIDDANIRVIITTGEIKGLLNSLPPVNKIELPIPLDSISSELVIKVKSNDLFVLLYTSGSTGKPKGVMIEHGNLVDRIIAETKLYKLDRQVIGIQTSNYVFDSSLLDLFLPISLGGRLVMPAKNEISDFHKLIKLMIRECVTDLQTNPNYLSGLLHSMKELNLFLGRYVKRFWSGGESIQPDLIKKAKEYAPEVLLTNHYGPTEGTIDATVHRIVTESQKNIIGKPLYNTEVYITDPQLNLQPIGVAGEICIGGGGLVRQYLNLPELTQEKFVNAPFGNHPRLYRTGDIGRWTEQGTIEFFGRLDDMIKIRGYRVEPGEVENVLSTHPEIERALVVPVKEKDGTFSLAAYTVCRTKLSYVEIRNFLLAHVPDFMVPKYIVHLNNFPVNHVGKINRKLLPDPETYSINFNREIKKPTNIIEEKLVAIWCEVLDQVNIGIEDNFFEVGGHSLKATQIIFLVYKAFDISIGLVVIFENPTIKELAEAIRNTEKALNDSIEPIEEQEFYKASFGQQRIWFEEQFNLVGKRYNIHQLNLLRGSLDTNAFQKAYEMVIERHESLRTIFPNMGGYPVQKIRPFKSGRDNIQFIDFRGLKNNDQLTDQILKATIHARFDLSTESPVKAVLIQATDTDFLFALVFHHIIVDEWSLEIFYDEFLHLYRTIKKGSSLNVKSNFQYKDFVSWQNVNKHLSGMKEKEKFWNSMFSDAYDNFSLPYDYPLSKEVGWEKRLSMKLNQEEAAHLIEFANRNGVTTYISLLSLFYLFIRNITGADDIVVGTISSGRRKVEFSSLIGFFLNLLALRIKVDKKQTFEQFLGKVKAQCLGAIDNEDYQYGDLLRKLGLTGTKGETPMIKVLCESLNYFKHDEVEDLEILPHEMQYENLARFQLYLSILEAPSGIVLMWSYDGSIFKDETIRGFHEKFIGLMHVVLKKPGLLLENCEV